jgi:hypothetical protein
VAGCVCSDIHKGSNGLFGILWMDQASQAKNKYANAAEKLTGKTTRENLSNLHRVRYG